MFFRAAVLVSASLALLGGAWIVRESFGGNPEQPLHETVAVAPENNVIPAAPEAAAAQINAAPKPAAGQPVKLEPVVALVKPADNRIISLGEAIGLFEKMGKGEVVKAEKMGEGKSSHFILDVIAKGARSRYDVNANGKTIIETAAPASPTASTKGKKGMREGREGEREDGKRKESKKRDDAKKTTDDGKRPAGNARGAEDERADRAVNGRPTREGNRREKEKDDD
jgi:hypothetical protein